MTNITIRELKPEDLDDYCRFLYVNFYGHEPVLQTSGDHKFDPDTAERRASRLAVIKQGLSLVAVDSSDGGRIVASAYASSKAPDDLEKSWNEVNEKKPTEFIDHVYLFLRGVEKRSNIFHHFEVSKALYLNILSVDATVRNQGLGRCIVAALIELGRSKGFPIIATSCTSWYSTRVVEALGMSCVYSENYSDYRDEDENVQSLSLSELLIRNRRTYSLTMSRATSSRRKLTFKKSFGYQNRSLEHFGNFVPYNSNRNLNAPLY